MYGQINILYIIIKDFDIILYKSEILGNVPTKLHTCLKYQKKQSLEIAKGFRIFILVLE